MDTITHGIAGALLGKAVFGTEDLFSSAEKGVSRGRILTWASMLGAIFPDGDIVRDIFSRDPLLVITWHRSITHSFLMLPAFALALAALTRWFARKRRWEAPSFALLTLVYAVGIASHILFDLLNSFGTMAWSPLEWRRPAWDLIYIVDLTFSGILLVPQLIAGVYRTKEGSVRRSLRSWVLCTMAALVIVVASQFVGVQVPARVAVETGGVLAVVFFAPRLRGWGFTVSRATWCRMGLTIFLVYIGVAMAAHKAALVRVRQFVASQHIEAIQVAAVPLPPSVWQWDGLIQTPRGVYEMRLDLAERGSGSDQALEYNYYPEALSNTGILEVRSLPTVQRVLAFARFPITRFHREGAVSVVEIADVRFHSLIPGRVWPFTYRVRLDAEGRILSQGWVRR